MTREFKPVFNAEKAARKAEGAWLMREARRNLSADGMGANGDPMTRFQFWTLVVLSAACAALAGAIGAL